MIGQTRLFAHSFNQSSCKTNPEGIQILASTSLSISFLHIRTYQLFRLKEFFSLILFFVFTILPVQSFGWGGRGHATLCEAAAFTVKNEKLREHFRSRAHILAHLCNIPDTHWKSLKGKEIQLGSSSHYIDTDMLGLPIAQIPADFASIQKNFTGKTYGKDGKTIRDPALDFGTLWWRIDQFHRKNLELAREIRRLSTPKAQGKPDDRNPFTEKVNDWVESMGLMGHFVGDLSQPFHNLTDYDGYEVGHGGIHAYYEEVVVSHFDESLLARITNEAVKLRKENKVSFLTAKGAIERSRALSVLAVADAPLVLKADLLDQKSSEVDKKGLKLRKPADRKPLDQTFKIFEPLVVTHLTRSVALLSLFWDEAYEAAGKPDLSVAKSYWYPFKPEFVPLDYLGSESREGKMSASPLAK